MIMAIKRLVLAFSLVLVSVLCLPETKASAYDYELKTSANRTGKVVKEDEVVGDSVVSVVENSNFRITLKTDKAEYHAGDAVRLKAEVEYIGSKSQYEITCATPTIAYKVEGSNGISLCEYVYWYKKDAVPTTFKKGEKIEEDFKIRAYTRVCICPDEVLDTEQRKSYGDYDVFYLPEGTYTFTATMTDELAKKKASTFYAELHLNIDVEGDVFYDGANQYRTLGDNEAVLIGTKVDEKIGNMGFEVEGSVLNVPSTVKHNGKKYTVTTIGDEGVKYYGFIEDYTYGYKYSGALRGHNFTTVKIPSSVKKISRYTFMGAKILSLNIEADDLEIGEQAFNSMYHYNESPKLEIKGNSVKIGPEAFRYSGITTIDLHNLKYLEIGEMAFADNYDLKKVTLPDNTVSIGSKAFYNSAEYNNKVTLTIPKGTKIIDGPVANKLLIKVADGNESYVTRYGLLLTADGSTVLGIADFSVKVIALPEGITEIKPYAFSETRIKKLTIPDTVTVIPEWMAYMTTTLKSVKLGKNVESVETGAFWANDLTKIKFPTSLKSIGENAFRYCKLKKVTIPRNVESLGNYAFRNNYFMTVTISKKNKTFKQSGNAIFEKGTKNVIGLVYSDINDVKYDKLDIQFSLMGSIYTIYIRDDVKEVDISTFSPKVMGEYLTGKNIIYEPAEVIFKGSEPPKFIDARNDEKEFFIWIFIPEDGDKEAYKAALEAAGLKEGTNFKISDISYEEYDDMDF